MEKYRSGHNGPDSKSGNPLTGTVGSNPTFSATRQGPGAIRAPGFFRIQKGNPRPAQAFQPVAARGKGLEPFALQAFSVSKRETRVLRKRFNRLLREARAWSQFALQAFSVFKRETRVQRKRFNRLLREAKNPSSAPKSTTPLPFGRGAGSAGGRRRPCRLLLRNRDFGRGEPWGNPQREWEMARPCFSNPRAA